MTWNDLLVFIQSLDQRFLDSKVEIYDFLHDITHVDSMLICDESDDYEIDVDQPQIWINVPKVTKA